MAKIKTPSAVKVRFKITKTGKVMRRSQNMRHLRRKKRKGAVRAYRVPREITGRMANKIRRVLGVKRRRE